MTDDEAVLLGVLLGANAIRVPAWCYVQDQGLDPKRGPVVSFVGASAFAGPNGEHPLMFGRGHYAGYGKPEPPGRYAHYLLTGEIILRPSVVVGTNALRGTGLSGLATNSMRVSEMLAEGELIRGTPEMLEVTEPGRRR